MSVIKILLNTNITEKRQQKILNEIRTFSNQDISIEYSSVGGNPEDFKNFLIKLKELKNENNLKINLICKKEVSSSGIYFLNNEYFDTIYSEKNCVFMIHWGYIYYNKKRGYVNLKNLNLENKEIEKMCIADLDYFGKIFSNKYTLNTSEAINVIEEINKKYLPYYIEQKNFYKRKLNPRDIEIIYKNTLNIILHVLNDFFFDPDMAKKMGFINEIL
jgi:hypothetical protein